MCQKMYKKLGGDGGVVLQHLHWPMQCPPVSVLETSLLSYANVTTSNNQEILQQIEQLLQAVLLLCLQM